MLYYLLHVNIIAYMMYVVLYTPLLHVNIKGYIMYVVIFTPLLHINIRADEIVTMTTNPTVGILHYLQSIMCLLLSEKPSVRDKMV